MIKAARDVVGTGFPIFCRFPASDLLPGGLELGESSQIARFLVNAGVDILEASGGVGGIEPLGDRRQGFFVHYAEA